MRDAMIRGWVCLAVLACALDAARGQTFDWEKVSSEGPGAITHPAMAYDSSRGVTIVYGGFSLDSRGNAVLNDTLWEWDGAAWSKKADTGPGLALGPAMVYDPIRQVTVLFGGGSAYSLASAAAETWTWDGESWREIPANNPPARTFPAMTFDRGLGGAVMQGGLAARGPHHDSLRDTYLWDGAEWTRLAEMPPRRDTHQIVYHEALDRTFMLQGNMRTESDSSLYFWSGSSWEFIPGPRGAKPTQKTEYGAVYVPERETVMIYGGTRSKNDYSYYVDELWEWDGESWSQLPMGTSPGGLAEMQMVYDSKRKKLVVFGGSRGLDSNGNRILSPDTWELAIEPAAAADWKIHR